MSSLCARFLLRRVLSFGSVFWSSTPPRRDGGESESRVGFGRRPGAQLRALEKEVRQTQRQAAATAQTKETGVGSGEGLNRRLGKALHRGEKRCGALDLSGTACPSRRSISALYHCLCLLGRDCLVLGLLLCPRSNLELFKKGCPSTYTECLSLTYYHVSIIWIFQVGEKLDDLFW